MSFLFAIFSVVSESGRRFLRMKPSWNWEILGKGMLTKGERRVIREEAGVDIRLICLYVDGCWCMTVNRAPSLGGGRNLCNSHFPRQSASADSEYTWTFLDFVLSDCFLGLKRGSQQCNQLLDNCN